MKYLIIVNQKYMWVYYNAPLIISVDINIYHICLLYSISLYFIIYTYVIIFTTEHTIYIR